MARKRNSGLDTYDLNRLDVACDVVARAFGFGTTYLVGTSQTSDTWRDVDVRVILPDEQFDALFAERQEFWSLVCMTTTNYLRAITDLPVDFQIQRRTEANEKFAGLTRNPIGRERIFAGGGDATKFSAPTPERTEG